MKSISINAFVLALLGASMLLLAGRASAYSYEYEGEYATTLSRRDYSSCVNNCRSIWRDQPEAKERCIRACKNSVYRLARMAFAVPLADRSCAAGNPSRHHRRSMYDEDALYEYFA